ncbi:hypothetical protein [Streptomyces sp. H27-S2]|uniref:hypothetical protein n=1 Tax=Streptomyces antarcticus TaxID=2996458 RepID=UPI00226E48ED|nr:hypothetical protein [Streptomyces sp. H27-S2]MCY0948147.1 hypothetical protein [Streptomyces sp. H27-S2]
MDTKKTPAPNAPEAETTPTDLTKAEASQPAGAETTTARASATATAPVTADAPATATADKTAPANDAEVTDQDLDDDAFDEEDADEEARSGGVGAAASAVVAAGLGLVALSGSWGSRVLAERQTLIGQIQGDKSAPPADQISALYGDAWQLTALANGVLSTLALLVAVFVLARPAFGAPGRTLPAWVRSVAWAAVVLGGLGILVFGAMYFLPLPSVPATPAP